MLHTVRIPLTLEFTYKAESELTIDEIHDNIKLFLESDSRDTLDITSYHWEA
jgi:hypothetical protein